MVKNFSRKASYKTLQNLKKAVFECIKKRHFPGAVYLIAKENIVLAWEALGEMSPLPKLRKPMAPNTIFDVASLTKPLVTAPIFIRLLAGKKLSPNDKVRQYVRQFRSHWLGEVKLKSLITHTSGLPAWMPLYCEGGGKEAYIRALSRIEPAYKEGKDVVYSCLGYILLGFIIEKITKKNLSSLFEDFVARPLGLNRTSFSPPASWRRKIAPTELGNAFERSLIKNMKLSPSVKMRESLICGAPHDANAYYLGGVAGNSGLFSTAWELYLIARSLLDPCDERIITADGKKMIFEDQTGNLKGGRTYGWKFASTSPPVSKYLPKNAIGHNGFTGTSLWIDPRDKKIYILLTNRVHPCVKPSGIDECRRKFHTLSAVV